MDEVHNYNTSSETSAQKLKSQDFIRQNKEWFTIIDWSDPKITDLYQRKCIRVPVYHKDYRGIPFEELPSRNVVAEFLSFYGKSDDVACLM